MRWNCGPTWEEKAVAQIRKFAKLQKWHDWFAWYPVRVGSHDCRWLETVSRRGHKVEYYDEAGHDAYDLCWEYMSPNEVTKA